jgi:hypothetical protein
LPKCSGLTFYVIEENDRGKKEMRARELGNDKKRKKLIYRKREQLWKLKEEI